MARLHDVSQATVLRVMAEHRAGEPKHQQGEFMGKQAHQTRAIVINTPASRQRPLIAIQNLTFASTIITGRGSEP